MKALWVYHRLNVEKLKKAHTPLVRKGTKGQNCRPEQIAGPKGRNRRRFAGRNWKARTNIRMKVEQLLTFFFTLVYIE
jgi:hypothetical protein